MLKIAQANIDTLNVTADLVLGDYLSIRFDRVFDAACLMGFFDYIEDPVPILKKLAAEVTSEFYASFPKSGGFWRGSGISDTDCEDVRYGYTANEMLKTR